MRIHKYSQETQKAQTASWGPYGPCEQQLKDYYTAAAYAELKVYMVGRTTALAGNINYIYPADLDLFESRIVDRK